MGTDVHVVVVGGPPALAGWAAVRIADLEARWSRFLPDSELSRLNAAGGHPTLVSRETCWLVGQAVGAWEATGGRFDPTVLTGLVASGYDRSFDLIDRDRPLVAGDPVPAPGCHGIDIDRDLAMVTLPQHVSLDLGGIGKGAAADLVSAELTERGAEGVCVNIGGDVRVRGVGPDVGAWRIGLACPGARSDERYEVRLSDGAVCTSTRLKRRWLTDRGPVHHLVDPSTGESVGDAVASVTIVAARAAQAEVLAKVVFVAGADEGESLITDANASGIVVDGAGAVWSLGRYGAFAA